MIITTESIVLLTRKFGDTSKILTAFTRDHGKVSLLAKGAFSPKSKFGSSLETLSRNTITFYKKAGRDLQTLSNSELRVSMNRMYGSSDHIIVGMLIAESLNKALEEYHPHPELYDYFSEILNNLNLILPNPVNLFTASQVFLANDLGFGLDFQAHDEILLVNNEKNIYFSLSDGNILEKSAFDNNLFRFDADVFHILKQISESNIENLSNIYIDERMQTQINSFFIRYFSYHLDRKFNYRTLELMKV